jgi:hypothetical protein
MLIPGTIHLPEELKLNIFCEKLQVFSLCWKNTHTAALSGQFSSQLQVVQESFVYTQNTNFAPGLFMVLANWQSHVCAILLAGIWLTSFHPSSFLNLFCTLMGSYCHDLGPPPSYPLNNQLSSETNEKLIRYHYRMVAYERITNSRNYTRQLCTMFTLWAVILFF